MSDPWTRSAPATWPYGPSGSSGDHVTGLANNTTLGLGVFSPSVISSPVGDIIIPPWIITTGSGSISGTINRYVITSENNTIWTGGINPNAGSDQTSLITALEAYDSNALTAILLDSITVSAANTAYYFRERFMYANMGNLPSYLGMLIQNLSGQALNATAANHSVTYCYDSYS